MKIKNIMLVTLMLLAVLAIGAVSAADDVAPGNLTVADDAASGLTVSDDSDIGANDDTYDESDIFVTDDEEICINSSDDGNYDENATIAEITLPENTKGSFRVYNGDEIVSQMDFKEEDEDDTWKIDENGELVGYILLKNFDLTKVSDGDKLSFQFWELDNGNYKLVDSLTQEYIVNKNDTSMNFSYDGMTDENFEIQVGNIHFNNATENFTIVRAKQNAGFFIITTDYDTIFVADLSKATCMEYVNDAEGTIYIFGFSLNDINNYLSQNHEEADSLKELVDDESISIEDDLYFEIYESLQDFEGEMDPIFENTLTVTDITDEIIFLKEEYDVYVDYENKNIEMKDDWNETGLYTFTVGNDIKGRIVIYINGTETPAFNKSLDELQPVYHDVDSETSDYVVTVADLNLNEAVTYEIHEYFVDENGVYLHHYDVEDPLIVVLYESQGIIVDDVTIDVDPRPTTVTGDESFITIGSNADVDDNITIVLDDGDSIKIRIGACRVDGENGNYIIGSKELKFMPAEGKHKVTITFHDETWINYTNLLSNLEIDIDDEDIINDPDFDKSIVMFRFREDGEIQDNITGKINLTLYNDDGNVVLSKEFGFDNYSGEEEAYVICTNDLGFDKFGKYRMLVKYYDGNQSSTEAEANVTFKEFNPMVYETAISNKVSNPDDYAITFKELPPADEILVRIDGNETKIEEMHVFDNYDETKKVYFIEINEFKNLEDGTHSVVVGFEANGNFKELASGNISVDLKENIDPSLKISIENITEGADAVIVISTNASFSGNVLVKIAGSNYTVSVTNGSGNYSVSGLTVGNHTATAIFEATEVFNASTKNTTFAVNPKVATSIAAPAVTTTYATSKNIVVTLKDANGNPLVEKEVTITLNGASKTIKTNAKGQASYAIGSKLVPKKYDAVIKFAGDSAYAASAATVKVTVKKAKAKITAKKKTFKAKKKTKKYTIVLKTDKKKALKNAKVTIKVGKKTYKAKTNAKGKATFKLKKLTKKGKYKATVKFAGNKYYNKLTKKVKITVKK